MLRSIFHFAVTVLLLVILFLTAGCAPPFPKEMMDKVDGKRLLPGAENGP